MSLLDLDPSSPVPIYLQIVEQVRRLIALGGLRPGDRLPTVRDLAVQCRVNRNTAARAIQELERDAIVRTRVGLGTFVADESPDVDPLERDSILDAQIDRVILEAHSLHVPLEQLPARLWRRIEAFRSQRAAGSTGAGRAATRLAPAASASGITSSSDAGTARAPSEGGSSEQKENR